MLILSRRLEESILIGDEIKITILSVKGKQVRLGIEAPKEIAVNREEIHMKIKASREAKKSAIFVPAFSSACLGNQHCSST